MRSSPALRRLAAAFIGLTALAAAPRPLAASGCPAPLFAYRTGVVAFSEQGRGTAVRVELADTPDKQEVGLMCRAQLDPDAGMLFVFPGPTDVAFWMKNTLIPLSIAFMDSEWRILALVNMPVAEDPTSDDPSKFPLYDPHKSYRYALEVNAGFFKAHGISERALVRFVPRDGGALPAPLRLRTRHP